MDVTRPCRAGPNFQSLPNHTKDIMTPTSRTTGRMQVRHTSWRSRHSNVVNLTIRTASQYLDPNLDQQQPSGNQKLYYIIHIHKLDRDTD